MNSGALAAVGRNDASSEAMMVALGGASALQTRARALRDHSGRLSNEQRFSGARIPGYRRIRTLAVGNFAELHMAETEDAELVAIKVARDITGGLGARSRLPQTAAGA